MKSDNINSCIRCGKCCLNGGPALHHEDIGLIHKNILHPNCLFTIRSGELVCHPLEEGLIKTGQELIKVKGAEDSWTCIFFDQKEVACNIYKSRPIECRVLKCWEPSESIDLFMRGTLSRNDIIPDGSILNEMISIYEERFPAGEFLDMFNKTSRRWEENSIAISKMISMDISFRDKFMESFGVEEAQMEFFFGRRLQDLAEAMERCLTKRASKSYPTF